MRLSPPRLRVAAIIFPLLVAFTACSEQPTAPDAPAAVLARIAPRASVAPTAWNAAGPGTVTLLSDGSSANPSMSYALYGSAVFSTQTWSLSTTAAAAGAITETFDYRGFHAFFSVTAFVRPFVIHNAVKTYLPGSSYGPANCCSAPSNGFHYTGNTTFNVLAGDTYGYEFGGRNYDSDSRLLGTFTIKYPELPADATPPAIASAIVGTLGNNGWYTSNVGVSWTVSDAESAITSSTGCGPSTLGTDSNGETYTCSATSTGGTASESVTIKRDATGPVIGYAGNDGSYTVDQTVNITCSASDAMSGLASTTCADVGGAAYTFAIGANSYSASAEDNAGNTNTASTQFTVQVTGGSLCALVNQWVSQKGVANSMCQQLRNGAYGAFRNHVRAQSGKTVSAAHAAILVSLSQNL